MKNSSVSPKPSRIVLAVFLQRQGVLECDADVTSDEKPDLMDQLRGHSVTYRIAMGANQGRKVFTLQTLPAREEELFEDVGKVAGFSLHAGVATKALDNCSCVILPTGILP